MIIREYLSENGVVVKLAKTAEIGKKT